MPATRSSSVQPPHRQPSLPSSHQRSKRHISALLNDDSSPEPQIVLPPVPGRSSPKRQKPARKQKEQNRPPPKPEEIIEISSDEDEPPSQPSQSSLVVDYRRQITNLRAESVKHQLMFQRASNELAKLQDELDKLRAVANPGKGKLVLDNAQLSDQLDCEICTGRLWTPMMLSDCGHTFCEPCLRDWFEATLKTFMATHPAYDPTRPYRNAPQAQQLMEHIIHNPQMLHHPQVMGMLEAYLPPQPTYTCPTCRKPATVQPQEVYALKSLVRTLAAAGGEPSPTKPPVAGRSAGRLAGPSPDVWGRFFPKRTP